MAFAVFIVFLASSFFLFSNSIVYAGDNNGQECHVQPHEIECLHIHLELIIKVALSDYLERNPHLKSQAPSFDPFEHVTIEPGTFTKTCLRLLASEEVRESLTTCVENYDDSNETYIPPSPPQMYRDLCEENTAIQSQLS